MMDGEGGKPFVEHITGSSIDQGAEGWGGRSQSRVPMATHEGDLNVEAVKVLDGAGNADAGGREESVEYAV